MFARAKWSLVVIPILLIAMLGLPSGIQADQCQGFNTLLRPIPPDRPPDEGIPEGIIRKYITGIQVTPRDLVFAGLVKMQPLKVEGLLSIVRPGDVTVDLTDGSMGTEYFSDDTSVVEVSENGVVMSRGPGITFITVKFATFTKIIKVHVQKT